MSHRTTAVCASAVFLCSALLLWWVAGNRLILVGDEGIYLEGAKQVLRGELPYRDFFSLTGPASFWNLALVFRLFGVSLEAARGLVVLDVSLIAVCLFWLTARFAGPVVGVWVAAFHTLLIAADPAVMGANHRWDSATLVAAGVALAVYGLDSRKDWVLAAAGATLAYGAWATPPQALVLIVVFGWIALKLGRRAALFCAGGVAAVSVVASAVLLSTGSFLPMLDHVVWTGRQYSAANRIRYGHIVGGYSALLADASWGELPVRVFFVFLVAMAAVMPVAGLIGVLAARKLWRTPLLLVVLAAAMAVAANAPRLDVTHLTYAAPLSYVVGGCAAAALIPRGFGPAVAMIFGLGAATMAWNSAYQQTRMQPAITRGGTVTMKAEELALVRELEKEVQPGKPFFAFPYLPAAYFVTNSENPTRFSFLQPGMMSRADEASALESLKKKTPDKVLVLDWPEAAWLRLFPSSDLSLIPMVRLRGWLAENYVRDGSFSSRHPGYILLRRKGLEMAARQEP